MRPESAAFLWDVHSAATLIGLRNILAHGYAVVDDAVVWSAASQRVPELLAAVDFLLAD